VVWSQPGQIVMKPYLKKCPTQNRADRVAQVVEPNKCETLSSNPSITQKQQQKTM
jgi:hypothetical protein